MAAAVSRHRKRGAPDQASFVPKSGNKPKRPRLLSPVGSIEDYESLSAIGYGAYSVVYSASHRETGKAVALKRVLGQGPGDHGPPDHAALATELACLAACQGHPSVVQLEGVATDAENGDVYIVTELADRGSLFDLIGEEAPFSEDVARGMMRQLLSAAEKMHGEGIVHRDIKPDNVLVGRGGELKLCDFGAAMELNLKKKKQSLSAEAENRPGTLLYTAPEQLMYDGRCYGTAVDVWALGCVMVELVNGGSLFDFGVMEEEELLEDAKVLRDKMAERGLEAAVPAAARLSLAGREVLAGLLAFDPDRRLTAAAALEHRSTLLAEGF